jgi:hypothetical protein
MHIKTSTLVAAGILALAGTPLALHLMGASSKTGTTVSWIKTLHGGGGSGHGAAATGHGSTGSTEMVPQSTSDVTGKWAVTIESAQGTAETHMTLKQDGKKITGTFASPHGSDEFPVLGERADNTLTFAVDGKTEHGEMRFDIKATVKKEDGTIAGTMTSSMGESKFTARRAKD